MLACHMASLLASPHARLLCRELAGQPAGPRVAGLPPNLLANRQMDDGAHDGANDGADDGAADGMMDDGTRQACRWRCAASVNSDLGMRTETLNSATLSFNAKLKIKHHACI